MPQGAGAGVSALLTDELCPRPGHAITSRKPSGGGPIIVLPLREGKRAGPLLARPAQDGSVTFPFRRPLIFQSKGQSARLASLSSEGSLADRLLQTRLLPTSSSASPPRSHFLHGARGATGPRSTPQDTFFNGPFTLGAARNESKG